MTLHWSPDSRRRKNLDTEVELLFSSFFQRQVLLWFGLAAVCMVTITAISASGESTGATGASRSSATPSAGSGPDAAANPTIASVPTGFVASKSPVKESPTATRTNAVAAGPAPGATSEVATPVTTTPATIFGISDPTLLNESASVQVEQLRAMKAIGITSVRLDANWYWGQPSASGSFDWGPIDQAVALIQKAGLSADLIIDGCPKWAAVAGAQGDQFAQPVLSTQFAAWARGGCCEIRSRGC